MNVSRRSLAMLIGLAAIVLMAALVLVGAVQALPFLHVPSDTDGDHIIDASDPQPAVYCAVSHADINSDGKVDVFNDIIPAISAWGEAPPSNPLVDQNHNDIADYWDMILIINAYEPVGYACTSATPDPIPPSGLGATHGPEITQNGPALLTGNEGSLTVTVSTHRNPTPYLGYWLTLTFDESVVQAAGGSDSTGQGSTCIDSINNEIGSVSLGCSMGFPSAPTDYTGPLAQFTFKVIGGGSPDFYLPCFAGKDNAGVNGGTYTIGLDAGPQLAALCGDYPPVEEVSASIGEAGGSIDTGSGDSVEVSLTIPPGALPAGALAADEQIKIKVYDIEELPVPKGDAALFSRGFSFEPDGLTFSTPAIMEISYFQSEILEGVDEETLDVMVYSHITEEWGLAEVIARDTAANTLTIALDHFSHHIPVGRDADRDGCPNEYEIRLDETIGGQRDMTNSADFFDVAGGPLPPPLGTNGEPDHQIDLFNDIVGVIKNYVPFGYTPGDPAASGLFGIVDDYDRGGWAGDGSWQGTLPPDGIIDLFNDIVGVIEQFGHDCR